MTLHNKTKSMDDIKGEKDEDMHIVMEGQGKNEKGEDFIDNFIPRSSNILNSFIEESINRNIDDIEEKKNINTQSNQSKCCLKLSQSCAICLLIILLFLFFVYEIYSSVKSFDAVEKSMKILVSKIVNKTSDFI